METFPTKLAKRLKLRCVFLLSNAEVISQYHLYEKIQRRFPPVGRQSDGWVELKVVVYRESGDALHLHVPVNQAKRLGLSLYSGLGDIVPPRDTSITLDALAERWRCPEWHINAMLSRGILRHFRVGKTVVRIRLSDVESLEELDRGPETVLQHRRFLGADYTTEDSTVGPERKEQTFTGRIREGSRE